MGAAQLTRAAPNNALHLDCLQRPLRFRCRQRLRRSVRSQRHSVGRCIMKLILLYGPPAVGKLTIAKVYRRQHFGKPEISQNLTTA